MEKEDLTNDFKLCNKRLERIADELNKQNTKLDSITNDVEKVDEKLKTTNKFVKGFNSFFGFFRYVFTGSSKSEAINKKKEIPDNNINNEVTNVKENNKNGNKIIDEEDELEKEILKLNENSKEINKIIKQTNNKSGVLHKKIDKTVNDLSKYNDRAKEILEK